MPIANVFASTMFKTVSLTEAFTKLPYKPGRIGAMGLFADQGVPTTVILVEEKAGILSLIPTAPRGGVGTIHPAEKRVVRAFTIPHIPLDDAVLADQVINVRAFGSENQLQGVAGVVNDKLASMKQDHEVTLEHLRIGALTGNILDADGSTVIYNLYTEFGVSQTAVDFVLGTTSTNIRAKCLEVKDAVEDNLGAASYDHVHCLCSPNFFRNLIDHDNVAAAYARWRDGEALRNDPRAGFEFAGIKFEEYKGSIGAVSFITDKDARFFPVGVPNMYKTYYAPADFIEAVGTVGQPFYAKQEALDLNRGVRLHTQSNPLPMCHRPAALVRGYYS